MTDLRHKSFWCSGKAHAQACTTIAVPLAFIWLFHKYPNEVRLIAAGLASAAMVLAFYGMIYWAWRGQHD